MFNRELYLWAIEKVKNSAEGMIITLLNSDAPSTLTIDERLKIIDIASHLPGECKIAANISIPNYITAARYIKSNVDMVGVDN